MTEPPKFDLPLGQLKCEELTREKVFKFSQSTLDSCPIFLFNAIASNPF
uniref:Uncharacterized protein n=1 Tax=Rhizophora mucronata TaxID=61149 RepID=A0A2P2NBI8_RHIMU